MIRKTFIHLDRINEKTEKNIWKQGITDWNDFIFAKNIHGISQKRKIFYQRLISKSKRALYNFDTGFFAKKLPSTETWRLYEFFKSDICFLDIETSGSRSDSDIIVVGIFNGINTKTFVKGYNLERQAIKNELLKYKAIATFNGSSFDLPFLNRKFPDIIPNIPHIDLRHCCNRVGLIGGLKSIEKELGIKRKNIVIERIYGGDPLRLWRMFNGSEDRYYLDLLIQYNEEDIINLKPIADYCYKRLCKVIQDEIRNSTRKENN